MPIVLATFACLFVAFGHVYPAVAKLLTGEPLVAFTPSRFFTDSVPIASVFAGIALAGLFSLVRIGLAPGIALVLIASITNIAAWQHIRSYERPSPSWIEAAEWIDANAPADAFVFNAGDWGAYHSWRENDATPIPISEPLPATIWWARAQRELRADNWPRELGDRQVLGVVKASRLRPSDRVRWRSSSGEHAVIELHRTDARASWPRLAGAPRELSAESGGTQVLELDGGQSGAGLGFFVLGSFSSDQSIDLPQLRLPLAADAYFVSCLAQQAPLIPASGVLGPTGKVRVRFVLPKQVAKGLVGRSLSHAVVLFDVRSLQLQGVSNNVPVLIID